VLGAREYLAADERGLIVGVDDAESKCSAGLAFQALRLFKIFCLSHCLECNRGE
jgi:hypothetical protein